MNTVALALAKTEELNTSGTSLTPCILDDDPSQLEMLSALVASVGYEAICPSDPEEALTLAPAQTHGCAQRKQKSKDKDS
jgi:hypothetical protein